MAFVAGCPKCQKYVLVPEGQGHDAVVQCPACMAEYSLGEILASIPALVVVRPSKAAAPVAITPTAVASVVSDDFVPLDESHLTASPAMIGGISASAAQHESDVLDFVDEAPPAGHLRSGSAAEADDVAVIADGDHSADELFAAAFAEEAGQGFAASPADEQAFAALAEPHLASVADDGDAHTASAGENVESWGGDWGDEALGTDALGRQWVGEASHGEATGGVPDDTIDLAGHIEPVEDDNADGGMAHIDFAAITGKAPPGAAATEGATFAAEPPTKKRRKREGNLFVRMLGMAFSGLLALACVLVFADWRGIAKFEFLSWLPWNRTTHQSAAPNLNSHIALKKKETPSGGNVNSLQAKANMPSADSAKPATPITSSGGKTDGITKTASPANPPPGPVAGPKGEASHSGRSGSKPPAPGSDEDATPTDPIAPGSDSDEQPMLPRPKKNDLGAPANVAPVGEKPKVETPTKPQPSPSPTVPSKPADDGPPASAPDDKTKPPAAAPSTETPKPEAHSANKPELPDPFATPSETAPKIEEKAPGAGPKIEKPPTEPGVAIKPGPAIKPDTAAAPETADPFANPPGTAEKPKIEKPSPEKPKADKPNTEPKPELPPVMKLEPAAKPDPSKEPAKSQDSRAEQVKPVPKPELPNAETPKAPELPKVELPKPPELPKPETPKAELPKAELPNAETPKAELPKAEIPKPEPLLPTKPASTIGPAGAPVIPAAQLDSALTRVSAAAQPAFGDLCQLAEAATFVQAATAAQRLALHDAVKKLAANPQLVARLEADAKKLLDGKPTKGGIAIRGKVTKVASKNGLYGTAVRLDGMANAVMVFSSHPLDLKEGDTAIVLGALVSEPAKNLPGYTGKLPIAVWADLAAAVP